MDCCVALLEKAKKTKHFLHDLALSSKDQNLAQYCNTSSWFGKSQPLKLDSFFYSLVERLSMFSATFNAFVSILLVNTFLRYGTSTLRRSCLPRDVHSSISIPIPK